MVFRNCHPPSVTCPNFPLGFVTLLDTLENVPHKPRFPRDIFSIPLLQILACYGSVFPNTAEHGLASAGCMCTLDWCEGPKVTCPEQTEACKLNVDL